MAIPTSIKAAATPIMIVLPTGIMSPPFSRLRLDLLILIFSFTSYKSSKQKAKPPSPPSLTSA
jgi:hypothetical protein